VTVSAVSPPSTGTGETPAVPLTLTVPQQGTDSPPAVPTSPSSSSVNSLTLLLATRNVMGPSHGNDSAPNSSPAVATAQDSSRISTGVFSSGDQRLDVPPSLSSVSGGNQDVQHDILLPYLQWNSDTEARAAVPSFRQYAISSRSLVDDTFENALD